MDWKKGGNCQGGLKYTISRNDNETQVETLLFKSLSCMQRYAGYVVCNISIIFFKKVTLFQEKPTSTQLSVTNASDNLTFLNISYINF